MHPSQASHFEKPIIRYFLLWMIGLIIFFLGLIYLSAGSFRNLSGLAGETLVQLISVLPVLWFLGYHIQRRLPLTYFGTSNKHPFTWLSLIGWWLVLVIFSYGMDGLFTYALSFLVPDYIEQALQLSVIRPGYGFLFNVLLIFLAAILTPVMEEMLFRGLLLHRLAVKWGIHASMIITSFLFGFLHGEGWIGSGVFGLCMCIIYIQTKNILIPIGLHISNNLVAVGLIFLSDLWEGENTLVVFRQDLWFFILSILIATPLLYMFIRKYWPDRKAMLPYAYHVQQQA